MVVKSRRWAARICLALLAAFSIPPTALRAATPPPVYVRGTHVGQGFLMTRLGKCYLVTAAHVVEGDPHADVVGTEESGPIGEARLIAQELSTDIAVLRVDGPITKHCGNDYVKGITDADVSRQSRAVVSYVYDNGRLNREAYDTLVVDADSNHLTLAYQSHMERLMEGLSGGIASINDLPAGMLLYINAAGTQAQVLRYEVLMRVVFQLMNTPELPALPFSPPESNLAAAAAGASLANWSSIPQRPEFPTSGLIQPPGPQVWKVSLSSGPASVDIHLAGNTFHSITSVTLIKGAAPFEQLVRSYELCVSLDGTTWFYVGHGEFHHNELMSTLSFPARLASLVKIRIFDSFDERGKSAALSRIIVR